MKIQKLKITGHQTRNIYLLPVLLFQRFREMIHKRLRSIIHYTKRVRELPMKRAHIQD